MEQLSCHDLPTKEKESLIAKAFVLSVLVFPYSLADDVTDGQAESYDPTTSIRD
jgi:hypothetical protein